MIILFFLFVASILSGFAKNSEFEKTGEDVTYLLDVSKHDGEFLLNSQTPFKKLKSIKNVYDHDLGKVLLSALSKIESDGINLNSYPRLIILGPGKVCAQAFNQRVLANTEIARGEFEVDHKSHLQVFPELKFGRTSAFVYYSMPNSDWCKKYSYPTKVKIQGTLELPFRSKQWAYAKKCGDMRDPHIHLVKTDLTVERQGLVIVGGTKDKKPEKGSFYGAKGYIHLEDSTVKAPKIYSSSDVMWDVAGDVTLHADRDKKSSIRGELLLNCQDERWASDVQCFFNKTSLKLKSVHLARGLIIHNRLAFDPVSKQCSIGCVELSENDQAAHITLKVTYGRSENEAADIVACLLKQKLVVFKYHQKPTNISVTFSGVGEKHLLKMNKKLVLVDDSKKSYVYLSAVSKSEQ